jgi:hypothetical protein
MRLAMRHVRWVAAAGLLGILSTPAIAQTSGGGAGGAATPAAGGSADAQVGFQRRTQLSPQEEVAEADKHIARMEQAARAVRKQLETARQQHDVVKSLCLDDKLSQIDVAVRSAKERKTSLASAVQRNDAELANHEYTILTVLRQRSEQLTAEANQCIGEEAAYLGETKVSTIIDPSIANEPAGYPPGTPGTDPGSISNQPPTASASK